MPGNVRFFKLQALSNTSKNFLAVLTEAGHGPNPAKHLADQESFFALLEPLTIEQHFIKPDRKLQAHGCGQGMLPMGAAHGNQ